MPTLELDELWSFVQAKWRAAWVWVALDRRTRQIVACTFGDRSTDSCRDLGAQVPEPWRQATGDTDFGDADQAVIPAGQHIASGKGSGQTSQSERGNNTLRQRLAQFVRKTLSFSQCDRMHDVRLWLFLHHDNLSRA